jgi:hypothetical protein
MSDGEDFKSRRAIVTFGGVAGVAGVSILLPGLKEAILAGLNSFFHLHLNLDAPPWVGVTLLAVAVVFLSAAFMGQSRIERAFVRVFDRRGSSVGTFLAVKHIGFAPAVRDIQRQELAADLSRRDLRHLHVDLTTDLNTSPPSLEAALAKQLRMPDQITAILGVNPDADLAYCGIVQAPFQLLAGYQLSSWVRLRLFEWHRHEHRWVALQPGPGTDLGVTTQIDPLGPGGDVAIAVEVSYVIADSDIAASVPDVGRIVRVRVAAPVLDCITHEGQVEKIARQFRAALDETCGLALGARVHVCCAAPMSVGIALGRMVSRTLHPPVRAYAYDRSAPKPYAWGIEVNGAPGSGQIVRS